MSDNSKFLLSTNEIDSLSDKFIIFKSLLNDSVSDKILEPLPDRFEFCSILVDSLKLSESVIDKLSNCNESVIDKLLNDDCSELPPDKLSNCNDSVIDKLLNDDCSELPPDKLSNCNDSVIDKLLKDDCSELPPDKLLKDEWSEFILETSDLLLLKISFEIKLKSELLFEFFKKLDKLIDSELELLFPIK